jgi:hypothetical protein
MNNWEKESTRVFIDQVLENLGLGPGLDPIITSNQNQPVNITSNEIITTDELVDTLKSVVNNIDKSKVDSMQDQKLKSIINYLEELV